MKRLNILNHLLIVAVAFTIIFGCKKKEIEKPGEGESGVGRFTGSVNLYDIGWNVEDKSGMKISIVSLENTYYAFSDSSGNFEIDSVPFGIYSFKYEKVGYGTFYMYDVDHYSTNPNNVVYGQTLLGTSYLGMVSQTAIQNIGAQFLGDSCELTIAYTKNVGVGYIDYIRIFLGNSNSANIEDFQSFRKYSIGAPMPNPVVLKIAKQELLNLGFLAGQEMKIKAFGDSYYSNEYRDNQGLEVFPNLNPSSPPSISLVIPH